MTMYFVHGLKNVLFNSVDNNNCQPFFCDCMSYDIRYGLWLDGQLQ